MTRLVVAVMTLLISPGFALAAEGERCKVTDPTGTPLNVRESPNGKIVGTLANGALVAIVESKDAANGKPWVKIVDAKTKKPIGWVFREFVSCF
jgi:Bacterial SH3 domain